MENIKEQNHVIANLMNIEIGNPNSLIDNLKGKQTYFKYNYSWDCLIPAYSKLCTLMRDEKGWCYFKPNQFKGYKKGPDEYIEFTEEFGLRLMRNEPGEACEILAEMIKWYNGQKD